jgi:bacillithiol system protein YtxJ
MAAQFRTVTSVDDLDRLISRSEEETVVLFNHDPYCPISARAFSEVQGVDREIAIIDVSRERTVTREIEQRTGVRHESPQVIVLRDGSPVWSASHFAITSDAVDSALAG